MLSLPAVGEPVGLQHLARIGSCLAMSPRAPSEYSISNLYLYRIRHAYALVDGDFPHILGETYDGERHAMPLCPLDAGTAAFWLEGVDCIYPLGEVEASDLAGDRRFRLDYLEADSDYLYDSARLALLDGAKGKRAQAARFEELGPRLCAFDDRDAATVLQGWLEDAGRGPDHADVRECTEAILRHRELGLEGVMVRLGNDPVAFLLAGTARGHERTVHFAKGRHAYAGAYPWMFARFAARAGARMLNFEQDLGNPGLAQSKRALGPVGRGRKYRLRRAR